MKLFQRNKKNRLKNTRDDRRSVVFIDRTKIAGGRRQLSRKPGFIRRRLILAQKFFKIVFILLVFVSLTAGIVILMFRLTKGNGNYISPVPLFAKSDLNEIDKKIKNELKKQNIEFIKIDITDETFYIILLKDKREVLIAADKDIAAQIASLQFILNRLTMEGRKFRSLDLRFNTPVIKME